MKIARFVFFLGAATMAFAASWNGKLIDAACHDNQKQPAQTVNACTPALTTTSFALQATDGKVYKLDAAGNKQAMEGLKSDLSKAARVTVDGTADGPILKVQSIVFGATVPKD
jgi:hypothetical protein